jgi:hypothetical protein
MGYRKSEVRTVFLHNFVQATISRLLASVLAGAALLTLIGAGSASAQVVMLRIPDDSPGIPGYARVERPFIYHTDEWAAIVFYRAPACVPVGFNLLDVLDIPGAFACPLTVAGFELWDNGPGTDAGPRQTVSSGSAVPVWFVPWTAFQTTTADDILTKSELESLNPLKGVATSFHEVLHPFVPSGTTGGAKVPHLTITASGILPDGRSFQYEFTSVSFGSAVHVRIVFR